MWEINKPIPVKLIVGILAADSESLSKARKSLISLFGPADLTSQIWPFTQTDYYRNETGPKILRQFLSFENLIDPGDLAQVKIKTNNLEKQLAQSLENPLPRPVNLDPGIIEPSKLILASTKNFAHRIYIGDNIYAEVTLTYNKGTWEYFPFTFPDFRESRYHKFLNQARNRVIEQQRAIKQQMKDNDKEQ